MFNKFLALIIAPNSVIRGSRVLLHICVACSFGHYPGGLCFNLKEEEPAEESIEQKGS